MILTIFLDTGPLGFLTNPKKNARNSCGYTMGHCHDDGGASFCRTFYRGL
jgi:hypothetical protein